MPTWLCKIWRLLANIVGKIVDLIVDVATRLLDAAVEALSKVADALGVGPLLLMVGLGALAYLLLAGKKEEEEGSNLKLDLLPPERDVNYGL